MTGVALAVFAATAAAARRHPVGEAEVRIFQRVNELPEAANIPLQVAMQFGNFGAIWATAAAVAATGRKRRAAAIAVAGTTVWSLCKVVKRVVRRDRPARLVAATIRGRPQSGLGFPSGHTAVAATLAALAGAQRPLHSRAALSCAAAAVAVARIYVGAHLPLDVAGGAALGVAAGTAADRALDGCRG